MKPVYEPLYASVVLASASDVGGLVASAAAMQDLEHD
jgi:hypothetical protein